MTGRSDPGSITTAQFAELGAMFRAAGITSSTLRRDFMRSVVGDSLPSVFDDWLCLSRRQAGDLLEALHARMQVSR